MCSCYANWQSGELHSEQGNCQDRTCPYDVAWVDAPTSAGLHHMYAECSNKGTCDRTTGECKCFEGYEGRGCGRMSCPDDCSGHGRCTFIEDVPYGANIGKYSTTTVGGTNGNDAKKFSYSNWDNSRARMCVCDAGYEGVNCALRSCPQGPDPMVTGADHVQTLVITSTPALSAQTYALTFTTLTGERFTTIPISVAATAATIESALKNLPGNVIDDVTVTTSGIATTPVLTLGVTFKGKNTEGYQNLLEVEAAACTGDGCTPMITGLTIASLAISSSTDVNNVVYTCGGRGRCDYTAGTCDCFDGFYGVRCEGQTALI